MTEPRTFIEFRPGMRRLIEDAIASLILLLDEIDGDDDMEPSLGSLWPGNHLNWAGGTTDDCEIEDEDDLDDGREPEDEI
jgi:hypothetical protein